MPSRFASMLFAGALALGACSSPEDSSPRLVGDPIPATSSGQQEPTDARSTAVGTQASEAPPAALDDVRLAFEVVAEGFVAPVLALPRPGTDELWVVEQPGRIQRIGADGTVEVVVDLEDRVAFGGERGLLGLAFPPDHPTSGRFFLHYSANGSGATTVEAWSVADGAARPDHVVLEVDQPAGNHNGGMIAFGPDGMLYVGLGDGGAANDRFGNGQRPDTLLGTILRLDTSRVPYAIPADNPFVDGTTAAGDPAAPEVWAWGLRNPWRFWIDPLSDVLLVGDVGQNRIEEVDAIRLDQRGANLGWPVMEGSTCFQQDDCSTAGLVLPVTEYSHDDGCSITGGVTYRGPAIPELAGHWFYSDFCTGFLRSVLVGPDGGAQDQRDWTEQTGVPGQVLSFGVDASGEVLVLTADGTIRRLVRA